VSLPLCGRRESFSSVVSRNGLHVAFSSDAPDLVAGDHNSTSDAFLFAAAAVAVSPTSGPVATEAGGSAQLTVALDTEPVRTFADGFASGSTAAWSHPAR
jgi:hypothetical protein